LDFNGLIEIWITIKSTLGSSLRIGFLVNKTSTMVMP